MKARSEVGPPKAYARGHDSSPLSLASWLDETNPFVRERSGVYGASEGRRKPHCERTELVVTLRHLFNAIRSSG